jgi:hypothetical protein
MNKLVTRFDGVYKPKRSSERVFEPKKFEKMLVSERICLCDYDPKIYRMIEFSINARLLIRIHYGRIRIQIQHFQKGFRSGILLWLLNSRMLHFANKSRSSLVFV